MAEEIINRVAQSKLMVIDLEDYYPDGERIAFDIKDWLYEGLVLREKEFRTFVKDYDWSKHQNQFVALTCSSNAIVPAWAYMLLSLQLQPHAIKTIIGDLEALETSIFQEIINTLDVTPFLNKPIIIKGCSNKPVPTNANIMLADKLKPVVSSIMYGEACSSVPLYKRK